MLIIIDKVIKTCYWAWLHMYTYPISKYHECHCHFCHDFLQIVVKSPLNFKQWRTFPQIIMHKNFSTLCTEIFRSHLIFTEHSLCATLNKIGKHLSFCEIYMVVAGRVERQTKYLLIKLIIYYKLVSALEEQGTG